MVLFEVHSFRAVPPLSLCRQGLPNSQKCSPNFRAPGGHRRKGRSGLRRHAGGKGRTCLSVIPGSGGKPNIIETEVLTAHSNCYNLGKRGLLVLGGSCFPGSVSNTCNGLLAGAPLGARLPPITWAYSSSAASRRPFLGQSGDSLICHLQLSHGFSPLAVTSVYLFGLQTPFIFQKFKHCKLTDRGAFPF